MKRTFTLLLITFLLQVSFGQNLLNKLETSVIQVSGFDKGVTVHIPAPLNRNVSAGTFKGTKDGQNINFYCIDISNPINPYNEDYSDAGYTQSEITYILNNYFPYNDTSYLGRLTDTRREASAIQAAIWYYSDSIDVANLTPSDISTRALEIIADADANSTGVYPIQTLEINLFAQNFTVGNDAYFTVEAYDALNRPLKNYEISLSIDNGTLSTTTAITDSTGVTDTITVTPNGEQLEANITASALKAGIPQGTKYYHVANPDGRQKLVLATPFDDEKEKTEKIEWFGQPNLIVSKVPSSTSVIDGEVIKYTLTVKNEGSLSAPGLVVSDVLPGVLDFNGAVDSDGSTNSYDPATGHWTVTAVAPGETKTLEITTTANFQSNGGSTYDLGVAKDYNLFCFNDFTDSSGDTEGRVAVGRNVILSGGYSVGTENGVNGGDMLVVGRKLTYRSGRVFGNIVYGNYIDTTHHNLADGTIRKEKNLIDFKAAKTYLKNLSKQLYALDPTGTVEYDGYGKLTLTGTENDLNIFEVSGSDLDMTDHFQIDIPDGAYAIVNYTGKNFEFKAGFEVNGVVGSGETSTEIEEVGSRVLLNFFKAKNIYIHNIGIVGSLLAPKAKIDFTSGVIYGQVICNKYEGGWGDQLNWVQFSGEVTLDTTITNVAEVVEFGQSANTAITEVYQEDGKGQAGPVFAISKTDFDPTKVTGTEKTEAVPESFKLEQNYPNPFNPSTTIEYAIPETGFYTISIYNVIGQKVATLVNREVTAGSYSVQFNASQLSSGIYFYRLTGMNVNITKKMMLMK